MSVFLLVGEKTAKDGFRLKSAVDDNSSATVHQFHRLDVFLDNRSKNHGFAIHCSLQYIMHPIISESSSDIGNGGVLIQAREHADVVDNEDVRRLPARGKRSPFN